MFLLEKVQYLLLNEIDDSRFWYIEIVKNEQIK